MKPLLVGEANPYYRGDDGYALFPLPERASGHRLATLVMGFADDRSGLQRYLEAFDRVNLCKEHWGLKEARPKAQAILHEHRTSPIVLCGQKVCTAFGVAYEPLKIHFARTVDEGVNNWQSILLVLPHPSGLCRFWNEENAFDRARAFLREHGVLS